MCVVMFFLFPYINIVVYLFVNASACTRIHHTYTYTRTYAHTHTHTLTLSHLRTHSLSLSHTHAREHFLESAAMYSKNQGEDEEETQDVRVCAKQYSE